MKVEKDFEEFVKLLNQNKVEYMVVGAYALALYANPRNTGDIDIFIARNKINAERILQALNQFGFESIGITQEDILTENKIIQLDVSPVRIDIMNKIDGVEFNDAYTRIKKIDLGNTKANFISYEDLIRNKSCTNRKKDQSDLEALQNFKP